MDRSLYRIVVRYVVCIMFERKRFVLGGINVTYKVLLYAFDTYIYLRIILEMLLRKFMNLSWHAFLGIIFDLIREPWRVVNKFLKFLERE